MCKYMHACVWPAVGQGNRPKDKNAKCEWVMGDRANQHYKSSRNFYAYANKINNKFRMNEPGATTNTKAHKCPRH